ncbi:MAG: hypothetical protein EBV42_06460 [Actinobacteria bacterium]|nr:hypothetical protein [Actinomycetota bacterium]
MRLINRAGVLVGNSSVGVREAGILGVPVVNIGTRQSGRERSKNVRDCGYSRKEIVDAITSQLRNGRFAPDYLYGDGKSGVRIAEILATAQLTSDKQFVSN